MLLSGRKGQGPGWVGGHGERALRIQEVSLEFCPQLPLGSDSLVPWKSMVKPTVQPQPPEAQQ